MCFIMWSLRKAKCKLHLFANLFAKCLLHVSNAQHFFVETELFVLNDFATTVVQNRSAMIYFKIRTKYHMMSKINWNSSFYTLIHTFPKIPKKIPKKGQKFQSRDKILKRVRTLRLRLVEIWASSHAAYAGDERTVIFRDADPVLIFQNSVEVQSQSKHFFECKVQVQLKPKKFGKCLLFTTKCGISFPLTHSKSGPDDSESWSHQGQRLDNLPDFSVLWRFCNCYGFFLVFEILNFRQINSTQRKSNPNSTKFAILGSGPDLADATPPAYLFVRLHFLLLRFGKCRQVLMNLRKREDDDTDALQVAYALSKIS